MKWVAAVNIRGYKRLVREGVVVRDERGMVYMCTAKGITMTEHSAMVGFEGLVDEKQE
jgi:hypothetical protein